MKKISIKNIHQPTSAKWSKIGLACIAVSGSISASAFATQHEVIGFIGIAFGAVGSFLSTLMN